MAAELGHVIMIPRSTFRIVLLGNYLKLILDKNLLSRLLSDMIISTSLIMIFIKIHRTLIKLNTCWSNHWANLERISLSKNSEKLCQRLVTLLKIIRIMMILEKYVLVRRFQSWVNGYFDPLEYY